MKEIITTPTVSTPVRAGATNRETTEYLIYFLFGLLEIILAFRLVLKLTGASLASGFVDFIYTITGLFILPFQGIFRAYASTSVLEPSTIVAILVYILVAWGIVKLLRISSGEQQEG